MNLNFIFPQLKGYNGPTLTSSQKGHSIKYCIGYDETAELSDNSFKLDFCYPVGDAVVCKLIEGSSIKIFLSMSLKDYKDPQLESRVKKTIEKISEDIHITVNDPSLAFYRLQENVRKGLPLMVDKRMEVSKLNQEFVGKYYDVEYAVGAIKSFGNAEGSFDRTQQLLRDAIFLKNQIKYQEKMKEKKLQNKF